MGFGAKFGFRGNFVSLSWVRQISGQQNLELGINFPKYIRWLSGIDVTELACFLVSAHS